MNKVVGRMKWLLCLFLGHADKAYVTGPTKCFRCAQNTGYLWVWESDKPIIIPPHSSVILSLSTDGTVACSDPVPNSAKELK